MRDIYNQFLSEYPVRYILKKGRAGWSCGFKHLALNEDLYRNDCVIYGDCSVYFNPTSPLVIKGHTYKESIRNYGVLVLGMSSVSSPFWLRNPFATDKHDQMISYEQYDLMCFIFALASIHFYIPVHEILTHEEYARKTYFPKYPNGYFPERWDFLGMGNDMRSKIIEHIENIQEVYYGSDDKIFGRTAI